MEVTEPMLSFSAEEKTSYLMSIDNLITLKMLHDFGIDVSGFVNFMMDLSYGSDASVELLREATREIFDTFEEFNPYDFDEESDEDTANRDDLIELGFGSLDAELYFICSSNKVSALIKNPNYQKKILSLFTLNNEYNFKCMFYEGDIRIHEQTGQIGISFEYVNELSDIFETLLRFLTFVDKFYKEMVGENNNEICN